MATTDAIGATSTGILALLRQEFDATKFGGQEAEFSLGPSSVSFGVSLVLWRVEQAPEAMRTMPQRGGEPPAPPGLGLDLHYLMTAWAPDPVDEQRLLGWAMRVLHDAPVLPSSLLNTHLPATFGPSETATLTPEPIPHDSVPWPAVGAPHTPASVGYVVRGLLLGSA